MSHAREPTMRTGRAWLVVPSWLASLAFHAGLLAVLALTLERPDVWGDPTVLDVNRLPAEQRALFAAGVRPGQVTDPAPTLPEPHASWMEPIEREWLRRHGT